MQELFTQLQTLQNVLSEKYKIETDLNALPQKLSTKEEVLTRLRHSQEEKQRRCEEQKKELHRLRLEMGDVEKRREMLEERMNSIKTQREYEALDKEIMDTSQNEQKLRRQIQHCENNMKELIDELERNVSLIESQQQELEVEKGEMDGQQRQYQQQLQQLEEQEQNAAVGLDGELLFKFDRILRNKEGLGIVPLARGICSGCHMILPAQFVADVRRGEDVHFCPYCSRILYYHDDLQGDAFLDFDDGDEVRALSDVFDYQEDNDFDDFVDE